MPKNKKKKKSNQEQYDEHLRQGDAHFYKAEFEDAIKSYTKALDFNPRLLNKNHVPNEMKVYLKQGWTWLEWGKYEKAKEIFDTIIDNKKFAKKCWKLAVESLSQEQKTWVAAYFEAYWGKLYCKIFNAPDDSSLETLDWEYYDHKHKLRRAEKLQSRPYGYCLEVYRYTVYEDISEGKKKDELDLRDKKNLSHLKNKLNKELDKFKKIGEKKTLHLYSIQGRLWEAIGEIKEARDLYLALKTAQNGQGKELALCRIKALVKKAKQCRKDGDELLQEGSNFKKAVEHYDEAIKYNSSNFTYYLKRASAKFNLEMYQEAFADYDSALQKVNKIKNKTTKKEHLSECYLELAEKHHKLGNYSRAIECYEKAEKNNKNPDIPKKHRNVRKKINRKKELYDSALHNLQMGKDSEAKANLTALGELVGKDNKLDLSFLIIKYYYYVLKPKPNYQLAYTTIGHLVNDQKINSDNPHIRQACLFLFYYEYHKLEDRLAEHKRPFTLEVRKTLRAGLKTCFHKMPPKKRELEALKLYWLLHIMYYRAKTNDKNFKGEKYFNYIAIKLKESLDDLAEENYNQGKYTIAIEYLRRLKKLVELHSTNLQGNSYFKDITNRLCESLYQQAKKSSQEKKHTEAITYLTKLNGLVGSDSGNFQGNWDAYSFKERLNKLLIKHAVKSYEQGEHKKAKKYLTKLIKFAEQNGDDDKVLARYYSWRAGFYVRIGENYLATEDYEQAQTLDKENDEYKNFKKFKERIVALEKQVNKPHSKQPDSKGEKRKDKKPESNKPLSKGKGKERKGKERETKKLRRTKGKKGKKPVTVNKTPITIRLDYGYQEREMHQLLLLKVLQNRSPEKILVAPPLGNNSRLQLKAHLQNLSKKNNLPETGVLLVPYLINLKYWVGLVIEWENIHKKPLSDDDLQNMTYSCLHPLNIAGSEETTLAVLRTRFKGFERSNIKRFLQSPTTSSSGTLTIENLLIYAKKCAQKKNVTLPQRKIIKNPEEKQYRENHAELLRDYYPHFYDGFSRKQSNKNDKKFTAAEASGRDRISPRDINLTRRENYRILAIIQFLHHLGKDAEDLKVAILATSNATGNSKRTYLANVLIAIETMMDSYKQKGINGRKDNYDAADLQVLKQLFIYDIDDNNRRGKGKKSNWKLKVSYYELQQVKAQLENKKPEDIKLLLTKLTTSDTREWTDYVWFIERNQLRFSACRQDGLPEGKVWTQLLYTIAENLNMRIASHINRPFALLQALNDQELNAQKHERLAKVTIEIFKSLRQSDVGDIQANLNVALPFARCSNVKNYDILTSLLNKLVGLVTSEKFNTEPRLYYALAQCIIQKYYYPSRISNRKKKTDLIKILQKIIDVILSGPGGKHLYVADKILIHPQLALLITLLGCLKILDAKIFDPDRHEKLTLIFDGFKNESTTLILEHLVVHARQAFLDIKKKIKDPVNDNIEIIRTALPMLAGGIGFLSSVASIGATGGMDAAFAIPAAVVSGIEMITPLLKYLRQEESQSVLPWYARLAVIEHTVLQLSHNEAEATEWEELITALTKPKDVIYKYSSTHCIKILTDLMVRQILRTNNKVVQLAILEFFMPYYENINLNARVFMLGHIKFLFDKMAHTTDSQFDKAVHNKVKELHQYMTIENNLIRPPLNYTVIDRGATRFFNFTKSLKEGVYVLAKKGNLGNMWQIMQDTTDKPLETANKHAEKIKVELQKRSGWVDSLQTRRNNNPGKQVNYMPHIMEAAWSTIERETMRYPRFFAPPTTSTSRRSDSGDHLSQTGSPTLGRSE